jgi:hypothetical protein
MSIPEPDKLVVVPKPSLLSIVENGIEDISKDLSIQQLSTSSSLLLAIEDDYISPAPLPYRG